MKTLPIFALLLAAACGADLPPAEFDAPRVPDCEADGLSFYGVADCSSAAVAAALAFSYFDYLPVPRVTGLEVELHPTELIRAPDGTDVLGFYTERIELGAPGGSLLHELFHAYENKVLGRRNPTHEGWYDAGWEWAARRFEEESKGIR